MASLDIAIVLAYFAIMLVLAAIASRKQSSVEDYYIAGGSLGTFSIACLWFASWIGGAAVVGVANRSYAVGISGFWYIGAMLIGALLFAMLFAARVKTLGREQHALTYPELIENRFDSRTRLVATLTTIAAYIAYAAGQLAAAGAVLHTLLGWDYPTALAFATAIIVSYTAFGGYLAVTWTDWLQVTLLIIGLVIIGLPLVIDAGATAQRMTQELPSSFFDIGAWGWPSLLAMIVSISLSFFTAMDSYTRMFAARDESAARNGTYLCIIMLVPLALAATWLGMSGNILFTEKLADGDILSHLVLELFPPGIKGLVLVALLAALMSTADICILTASANVSRDVYQRYIAPDASERKMLRLSMVTSLVIGVLAALMAWQLKDIVDILLIGFTINSAALFLPSVAMVYSWRVSNAAAFWSSAMALATVVLWYAASQIEGSWFSGIDPLWPGLTVSFVLFFLLRSKGLARG